MLQEQKQHFTAVRVVWNCCCSSFPIIRQKARQNRWSVHLSRVTVRPKEIKFQSLNAFPPRFSGHQLRDPSMIVKTRTVGKGHARDLLGLSG